MAVVANISSQGQYALNPRGNLWLKEENKYGEKLMKKMGWTEGKGLGKHEDGIKENIKSRPKFSKTGVGWKHSSIDTGNDSYNLLLKSLSENYLPESVEQNSNNASLEERSEKFKKRLNYRKFVKGKDISQYSEKDMQSIFVTKPKEEEKKDTGLMSSNVTNGFQDKLSNSILNLVDYFAQKLKQKKHKRKLKDENGPLIDSVNENSKSTALSFDSDQLVSQDACKKKKQKKSKSFTTASELREVAFNSVLNYNLDHSPPESSVSEVKSLKFTKKRKISDSFISNSGEEASLINSSINNVDNLHSELILPENAPNKSTKKRKRCEETISKQSEFSLQSETDHFDSSSSKPHKKRKKSDKNHSLISTIGVSPCNFSVNDSVNLEIEISTPNSENEVTNSKPKKSKKVKKKKMFHLKSCLKEKINFKKTLEKQVSFNKLISYKTFDHELAVDSMNEEETSIIEQNKDATDVVDNAENSMVKQEIDDKEILNTDSNKSEKIEIDSECLNENKLIDAVSADVSNKKPNEQENPNNNLSSNGGNCEKKKKKKVIKIPSAQEYILRKISVYDAWIDKQREVFKKRELVEMYDNINTHHILGSSNLTQIKGYGNWGL